MSGSNEAIFAAFTSGILFNFSNVLIVIATDLAGIAIAFPIAVGLAVVIGTAVSYWQAPAGRPLPLFFGLAFLLLAMLLSTMASSLRSQSFRVKNMRGVYFALASGCIMGFFYPRLASSMASGAGVGSGKLSPYAAAVLFAVGLVASNVIINTVLMVVRGQTYARYFKGSLSLHIVGFAGGCIWMIALISNLIASSVAGPAVSYALGQGATLVAALWGVIIWKEFHGASTSVVIALTLMFTSYGLGLLLIGAAAF
jgi:glucose uptake protein